MSDWHTVSIEQALKELNTDVRQGLTNAEAHRRLKLCDYNEVRIKRKEPTERQGRKESIVTNIIKRLYEKIQTGQNRNL